MAAFLTVDALRAHAAPVSAYVALVQGGRPPAEAPQTKAYVVHDIPGRLRIVVPSLKGDDRCAVALRVRLGGFETVQAVQFNPLTGSMLVAYDRRGGAREAVFQALDDAGYRLDRQARRGSAEGCTTPACDAESAATVVGSAAAAIAVKAVLHCLLDLALESAIAAVV